MRQRIDEPCARQRHMPDYRGDLMTKASRETRFGDYVTVNGMRLSTRILTDADLYFPDDRRTLTADEPGGHAAFTQNLLSNITYRRLQVDAMMPIHGRFVTGLRQGCV
jgi:hypothetical protein